LPSPHDCKFTKGALHYIWAWFHFHGPPPLDSHDLATWNSSAAAAGSGAANLRRFTDVLLYCWWNIWKERNRRVFDSKQKNELQVEVVRRASVFLPCFHFAYTLLSTQLAGSSWLRLKLQSWVTSGPSFGAS
jgi:hypothetical protein